MRPITTKSTYKGCIDTDLVRYPRIRKRRAICFDIIIVLVELHKLHYQAAPNNQRPILILIEYAVEALHDQTGRSLSLIWMSTLGQDR